MSDRLVFGLSGCVDYELSWDASVLESMARSHRVGLADLDDGEDAHISDERSWLVSLLCFLRRGAGGERGLPGPELATRLAAHFSSCIALGGTGLRAALALSRLGIASTVHLVSIDETVRSRLPSNVRYLASQQHDGLDPHLIVQYPAGTTVRLPDGNEVTAPFSNRVIYVADQPNREMRLSAELPQALSRASAFLVSGFNAMSSPDLVRDRLRTLRGYLRALSPDALVFYEDAGFHDPALRRSVYEGLAGAVDIHSLNEDELQSYVGRRVDLLNSEDVMRALGEFAPHRLADLVVVHTAHWALAYGPDAHRHGAALQTGVDLAATRYRWGDELTSERLAGTRLARQSPAGAAVCDGLVRLAGGRVCCVAARSMPATRVTTIGLGDTFVAGFLGAGLIHAREGVRC